MPDEVLGVGSSSALALWQRLGQSRTEVFVLVQLADTWGVQESCSAAK